MAFERQSTRESRSLVTDFPEVPRYELTGVSPQEIVDSLKLYFENLDGWWFDFRQQLQRIQGPQTTTDLPEGENLYYTNARAAGAVSAASPLLKNAAGVFSWAGTTTNVPEGTNLYYTDARAAAAAAAGFSGSFAAAFNSAFTTKLGTVQSWTAVQTFAGINLGLAAYVSDPESTPYSTVGAGADIASMAELNLLRVAYENLRVDYEALRLKLNV